MKILGVSGSPRDDIISGVYKLVKTVLENTGCDYELVSLKGKKISGCTCCLGCAEDNVCKLQDDMTELREKIAAADAYVIGAPNYYSTVNAATHAFLERWFQFRHREEDTQWGKLGVSVGVGGTAGQAPADEIAKFYMYNFIEPVAKIDGLGAPACYWCGYGETCKVGIPHMIHGEEGIQSLLNPADKKFDLEKRPDVTKQPDVIKSAVDAGKLLGKRLNSGHDRKEVAQRIMGQMMEMLKSSV